MTSARAPSAVVLVEPPAFFPNTTTMRDNHFQADSVARAGALASDHVRGKAELQTLEAALADAGVSVARLPLDVADSDKKPDAIFPNNSISITAAVSASASDDSAPPHPPLDVVLWPMSPGRRDEVPQRLLRACVEAEARGDARIHDWRTGRAAAAPVALDGATLASERAVEGTGAVVFTPDCTMAVVGVSQRADLETLRAMLEDERRPFPQLRTVHVFAAADRGGKRVYHTNVVGWLGGGIAAWNLGAMSFVDEAGAASASPETTAGLPAAAQSTTTTGVQILSSRRAFCDDLRSRGVQLLDLSHDEMDRFCGNCLELVGRGAQPVLTMSRTAFDGYSPKHKAALVAHYGADRLVAVDVPAIEQLGGGSVRCLQAHVDVPRGSGGDVHVAAMERLMADLTRGA